MTQKQKNTQRQDAIDVLGDEYADLIDELEAIIRAIGKGHGAAMVLKSEESGAQFWAQLIVEAKSEVL